MTSTADQLRVLLGETAFLALESLAASSTPVSGRALARALRVAPTTATSTLQLFRKAGFVVSSTQGRSQLWQIDTSNPMMHNWLHEPAGSATQEENEHRLRPRLTVVIFTALQLEYEAVVSHLPDREPDRVGTTRFEAGSYAGDHADWKVYLAELGVGNTRTATASATVIAALNPHLVLFVGIAASAKPDDLVLGDVVVADRVYDLHSGKDVRDDTQGSVHRTRPLSYPAANGVVQLAMDVRRNDWTAELTAGQALNARGDTPCVEIKPIAAGSVLHSDGRSALMDKVRTSFDDVAAVDMESLGLYETAHRESLPALAVRGISDCVENKTPAADRAWQPRAANHAAAFAFALLRRAAPEDLPRPGVATVPVGSPPSSTGLSPVQLLLRVAPLVALAYEWAEPLAGARATAVLKDLVALGSQPATWLGRFRHRPPQVFRDERSGALWVLVAEFACAHEHPAASWFFEQAAQRWQGDPLAAYLLCRGAVTATRDGDTERSQLLLARSETAEPVGRPLWELYRTGLGSDNAAIAAALLPVTQTLSLPLPRPVLAGLGATSAPAQPDDAFVAFVEEFAELHPVFLESIRLTLTLTAAMLLRESPDHIDTSHLLLEDIAAGFPPYRPHPANRTAVAALTGPRAAAVETELAKTLLAKAAGPLSRIAGFSRDAALTRAEDLALSARGRRQDWGGPAVEALVLAAQARALKGDPHGALAMLLPAPAGTAEAAEASTAAVVEAAAEMAAHVGDTDVALELAAKLEDPIDRRHATALALTTRPETHPEAAAEFRAALTEIASSGRADQKLRVLLGLSLVAPLDEDELSQLEALDPESADMVRAQEHLSGGNVTQALILARRYPDSDAALHIRVQALMHQGKTADAVRALERFAVRHGHDERHLLAAAHLALSTASVEDAERLASALAASTDATRRRAAREILLEAASRREDWNAVLNQAQRLIADQEIAEGDPNRDASLTKYRWAQVFTLHQLRRMHDAYDVIRAEPRLEAADRNQARLIASVLRAISPSVSKEGETNRAGAPPITQAEILNTAAQAAQAFPDDEELVATAVMTGFMMPSGEDTDYHLLTQTRRLHQQFFEHFPHSKLIEQVPVDDALTSLQEFLRARVAPVSDALQQMQRAAVAGQIPIGACAGALGRSHADMLIHNAIGCYVIRDPNEDICALEIAAARRALNTSVVVDTSALFVSPIALEPTTQLTAHFEQLLVAAPQRDDILQARSTLSMKSSGWLGWDPRTEQPTFTEYSGELTRSWSDQAHALATAVDACDVLPDVPGDDGDKDLRVWSAPIRLARELGVSLLADDAALRAFARSQGVSAFGSLHLLEALVQDDALPADALEQSHRRLMAMPVAELPVRDQLITIARSEQWNPNGYAAFLFTRPSTWQPLADGWRTYTSLIRALPDNNPQRAAGWCLTALRGVCMVATAPAVPAVAGTLVAWTLFELADGSALPLLLEEAEHTVRLVAPEADLLQEIVQRLVTTVRHITPAEQVGPIVLRLLAGLDGETHVKALKIFFTMP
ncbi:5'-methylthioadenosine/S-adenosylhomocysteine nucleosidase [Streptomyces lushanensis]|uniref:5'-methylthioadenosine/S-adenosylhomocysteine nucleosidase n=1 Tax=Streptomyces lushanensis TaxID=1434255 RepID=UPI00082C55FC|nr:5'-methylthioadenosine/S-adenosylhomocysteine nucleosidase [Streptomyces lushanensis]